MGDIDIILGQLKQRVLLGETLNNFKKEIQQIADIVDKKDTQWNSSFSANVSQKLSSVLQK